MDPPKDLFYDPQEHVNNTSLTTHTSPSGSVMKRTHSTAKLSNRRGRSVGHVNIVAEHFVNPDGTMFSDAKMTFVLPKWTETFHYSYDDADSTYFHTKKNFTAIATSASGVLLGKNYKMTYHAPARDKLTSHTTHGRVSHEV
jgi:hypothetical protein